MLNKLDPKTYSSAESYAMATGKGRADVDPNKLARRAFDLTARRQPGKALIFIIDEVGQYVSRSVDKMLDLQAIIQAFGVEGKNRTERHEAVSPFWIVVTSQEKLNEVVTALDSKRIELARLQDRFRIPVDLKQSDIAEVTSKRVLDKKKAATEMLQQLFDEHEPRIQQCCTLERTSRNLDINRNNFAKLYPYLPYQIDLCIDVVAGLRLKRGAHRHVGGSNRTIIKQAQQMMVNDRTKLADAPIGTLVTLDKVYELLYLGNLLPTETTREVDEIAQRLPKGPMAQKVAKAIALLESVMLTGSPWQHHFPHHTIDRQTLPLPDVLAEDFGVPADVLLKPVLDAFWQSAGFASCNHYNNQGRWDGGLSDLPGAPR